MKRQNEIVCDARKLPAPEVLGKDSTADGLRDM